MIKCDIVKKLFPNSWIPNKKSNKRNRFELPSKAWDFAFSIDNPASGNNSSRSNKNFTLLDKIDALKNRIFVENFFGHNFTEQIGLTHKAMQKWALQKRKTFWLCRSWRKNHNKRLFNWHEGWKNLVPHIHLFQGIIRHVVLQQNIVYVITFFCSAQNKFARFEPSNDTLLN